MLLKIYFINEMVSSTQIDSAVLGFSPDCEANFSKFGANLNQKCFHCLIVTVLITIMWIEV